MDSIYKISFDGALFTTLDRAGIGVIIRDCKGLVIASLSHSIPLPLTMLEIETMGVFEILVNSLMEDSLSLASFGLLIQDVKAHYC